MKRMMILAFAVTMALAFALPALATGPLLGFSMVPDKTEAVNLTVGFNVASFNLELQRSDLQTLDGVWSIGVLWVPQVANFGYRAGVRINVDYDNIGISTGLTYAGFEFVVGTSVAWGPLQLYLDANIGPTRDLMVVPIVGVNLLFSELIPSAEL